jgi:tetratricopeptide (TPR) repeat protein
VTDEWAPHLEPARESDQLLKDALFMKERVLDGAGRRQEQQAVIDRLLPVVERVGDALDEIELDMRQGDLFSTIRRYDDAERVLERVLERSREAEDPVMQRKALRSLGMVWWYQDDGREAEVLKLLEEALELDVASEDIDAEIGERANICTMLLAMGEVDRALEFAESLTDLIRPDDIKAVHLANYSLGRCHRALGNNELAREHFEQAAALPAPNTNSSFLLSHLAGVQVELGEPEEALETYSRIIDEARRHGHTDALAHTLKSAAGVLEGLDRGAEAIPLLEEAQQLFGRLQDRKAEAGVAARLADLYSGATRLQDAVAAWGTVRQLARRLEDAPLELRALEGLAGATREHFGEDDLAVPLYEEASSLAESLGDAAGAARLLNSLGVIGWNRGDLEAAREFYERALAAADAGGRVDDVVLIRASLGAVHRKSGELQAAVAVLEKAVEEGRRAGADPLLRGYALGVLGDALFEMRDLGRAECAYSDSLELRRALGDERGEAWMLVKLSDVEVRRGALDRVRELNSRAYDIASRLEDEELIRASTGRERY